MDQLRKLLIWMLGVWLLILSACAPSPTELPTLVRLPSATATLDNAEDLSLTEAEALRTPLPASYTPTFTPSYTPTLDPSVTPTLTQTATVTPSATITDTPTATATEPPPLLPEDRPILAFALTAAAATVLPQDYQVPDFGGPEITLVPVATATLAPGLPSAIPPLGTQGVPLSSTCAITPGGGFGTLYQGNPDIANQLGCPSGGVQNIPAAWQTFETGYMVWLNGEIIVLYSVSDSYERYPDTFIEGSDPETSSEVAPAGLFAPIRGFLKVWSGNAVVRDGLGWAVENETGTTANVQSFNNGQMIYLQGRSDVFILIGSQSGTWQVYQGSY